MKKIGKKLLGLGLTFTLAVGILAGCGSTGKEAKNDNTQAGTEKTAQSGSDDKVIRVGASVSPHAEILEQVKPILEKEGYTLDIVEYNDYVLPNTALNDGDLDANYFQHQPYLTNFNEENGTDLVSAGSIHFEPLGIYSEKLKNLDDIEDGAKVAVPNDATNEARALLLLEANGLIKLKEDAGVNATVLDIKENPHNLQIQEIAAEQLVRALPDVAIACINGNYAIQGGYQVAQAIAVEESTSLAAQTYANVVAVRAGEENSEKTQALVKALQSDEIRKYIEDTYAGAVVPVF